MSMKKKNTGLSHAELLSLDVLITVAQQRGRSLEDRLQRTEEVTESLAEMTISGPRLSESDLKIIRQIRELASRLEIAPTLDELVKLRGESLRQG
ncbi:MAG: hypothetical protein M3437_15170 [Chloroflexota bacterium]|nr:hypothetical protein [Chloroflexota bacterium]MDQ5867380.1 hypothetical protein [Chloroflexota bacterium]